MHRHRIVVASDRAVVRAQAEPRGRPRAGLSAAAPRSKNPMATYIALCDFTDQGIRNIKETTHRAEMVGAAGRKAGVTVKSILWTLGSYDLVAQFEAAHEAAITAFGLAIGMQGNVRTQTMRAFTRDEMNAILAKLPG
jgi:uncharacterized protein with GYD domain